MEANINTGRQVSFFQEVLMRPLWHRVKPRQPLWVDEYVCKVVCFVIIIPDPSFLQQGSMTFSCTEPVSVSVTFTDAHSFLQLPGRTSWSSGLVSVNLQFRTWNKAGLLLTFAPQQQGGSVSLFLSETRLRLQISKADRTVLELNAGVFNDILPTVICRPTESPNLKFA